MLVFPDAIIVAVISIFLFLALCGALVLVLVSMRRPTTLPLAVATGLVVISLIIVAVSPLNVPTLMGVLLAVLATALGVMGGNPISRRILEIATRGHVRDGAHGGIILTEAAAREGDPDGAPGREVMRGGTTIGYLERLSIVVALIAGFPEAIAIVVAVKGVGRFSELSAAESRERFIIGTLASLLWACVVGALIRLAIW